MGVQDRPLSLKLYHTLDSMSVNSSYGRRVRSLNLSDGRAIVLLIYQDNIR